MRTTFVTVVTLTPLLPFALAHPTVSKRGPTDTYGDHTGSWSSHTDGTGQYIRSDDVYHYSSGDKCWTDLFYVSSSHENTDWEGHGDIKCVGTSECESGIDKAFESCVDWSMTVSAGAEFNILKDIFSVSASTDITNGWSKCDSISTPKTCKWTDQGCHQIFTSFSVKVNHGYVRRRCNFKDDAEGDRTVWSKDWDVKEKGKENDLDLGCDGSCGKTTYP